MNDAVVTYDSQKRSLMAIPVLKLPADNLDKCLQCLTSARRQLRKEVVAAVLKDVYPDFDEKRAFRALVAPTLTRLHFARSNPPFFRSAPNSRIWKTFDEPFRRPYVSVVLYDFATVRLGLNKSMLPPAGSLREAARDYGPRMIDRVRGLDSMLRLYAPFHPDYSSKNVTVGATIAGPNHFKERKEQLYKLIESVLPPGRIVVVDETRYLILAALKSQNIFASSFVVDEWLRMAIRERWITSVRAPFASIVSLIVDRFAIDAVAFRERH